MKRFLCVVILMSGYMTYAAVCTNQSSTNGSDTAGLVLCKPTIVDSARDIWGRSYNANMDTLDASVPDKREGKFAVIKSSFMFDQSISSRGAIAIFKDSSLVCRQLMFNPVNGFLQSVVVACP